MSTWHATLSYTLELPPDAERLHALLADAGACARLDGDRLEIDVLLTSVSVDTPPVAARVAGYVAKRALYAAGAVVSEQSGLAVHRLSAREREHPLLTAAKG